jgi:hypothetical protein
VPTTLIHPSLEATESDDLFRHVDLAPTVAGLVDSDATAAPTDGRDVLTGDPAPYGASLYDRPYPSVRGEFSYTIDSLWDHDGGHVSVESGLWDKFRLTAGFLTRIPAGIQLRRSRSLTGLKYLFASQYSWGAPGFSVEQARDVLAATQSSETDAKLDMSSATRKNLEDLGYL